MEYKKTVVIELGDQKLTATVTVDMPDLPSELHLDARMILAAVAANQNLVYSSRHHKDRNIRCIVQPERLVETPKHTLRLVA